MDNDPAAESTNNDDYVAGLEARVQHCDRLAELIVIAEQRLAHVPELELRIADLEFELAAARRDAVAAREEAMRLDQMLMYGRRMLRFARPFIKPLRDVRQRLRS